MTSFFVGFALLLVAFLICTVVGAIIDVVIRSYDGDKNWRNGVPLFLLGMSFIFILAFVVYISIQIGDAVLGHAG